MAFLLLVILAFFATNVDGASLLVVSSLSQRSRRWAPGLAFLCAGAVVVFASACLTSVTFPMSSRYFGLVPMTLGVFECVRRSKAKPGVGKPVAISGAAHFFLAFIALSTDNLAVFWTLFARQDRKMVLAGVLILLSLYAVMACLSVLVSRHRISIKGRWLNWLPPTVMIYIGTSMMLQA